MRGSVCVCDWPTATTAAAAPRTQIAAKVLPGGDLGPGNLGPRAQIARWGLDRRFSDLGPGGQIAYNRHHL